jgi:hypothetical protein
MPIDTYGIRFSVSDGSAESDLNVPNVYLLYCTLGEFLDGNLKSNELFGSQDWQEIPIIGGIGDDVTDESYKEIGMLYDWFVTNGCDYKKREIDPMDLMGVHEKYVGERILLDIIEELAPKIKQAAKETFGREILMLLGGDIFRPSDIKRIERINGKEAESFLRYHECLVEQERSELEQLLNHFKKIL